MKKILFIALLASSIIGTISCSRSITPAQAANGRARCGDTVRW